MIRTRSGPGRWLKENALAATVVLTVVGYALVIGTFVFDLPIYPDLTNAQVNLLTHLIAAINTTAVLLLVLGWRFIRRGQVQRHRRAMTSGFALIVLFLVIYLLRVGGGGTKVIAEVNELVRLVYQLMLGIHIILSIVAIPVVLYVLILGITHSPAELPSTRHAKVGRLAVAAWILSLVLGVVTYVMLNHVYSYEFVALAAASSAGL